MSIRIYKAYKLTMQPVQRMFCGEVHIIKMTDVEINTSSGNTNGQHQKKRPPPGAAISERGSFLVLAALQPSVKPLADVVRRYIRCDGHRKRKKKQHRATPPYRLK